MKQIKTEAIVKRIEKNGNKIIQIKFTNDFPKLHGELFIEFIKSNNFDNQTIIFNPKLSIEDVNTEIVELFIPITDKQFYTQIREQLKL